MKLVIISIFIVLVAATTLVNGRPQEEANQPEPYEYQYEVKDPEQNLFFDKNEIGDETGKVTGRYSVWLPDGRLMTVDYTVEKDTGFVPKVTFQDNANPLAK